MEENLPPDQSFADLRAESLPPSNEGESSALYQSGQTIGDFRLVRLLGEGGMGTVWEAVQESLGRKVALKMLSPQVTFSPKALARFQREAEAGARLSHTSIVTVHAVGEAKGIHYIAQELIKGGSTLADTVEAMRKRSAVPEDYYERIAGLFAQVAEGLQAAHAEGIIHRDLKPQNILMAEDGRPLVADFGLAQIEDALELSQTGDFAGTPYYMSPEQAMSKRMGIDHRTDIFSLGATFYECLALGRPFEGDSSHQVLKKIVLEDPPDPRKVRSRVPRDLVVICQKAMEKRPEDRYQSMEEFAAELQRFLNHEPILAKPPGIRVRFGKWRRRHPVITVSSYVGGVLLLLLVASVWDMIEAQQIMVIRNQDGQNLFEQTAELFKFDPAESGPERASRILDGGLGLVEEQAKIDSELGAEIALMVAGQFLLGNPREEQPWQALLQAVRKGASGSERGKLPDSLDHRFSTDLSSVYFRKSFLQLPITGARGRSWTAGPILKSLLERHREHNDKWFQDVVGRIADISEYEGNSEGATLLRDFLPRLEQPSDLEAKTTIDEVLDFLEGTGS